jgi:hypothetical protein
MRKHKRKTNMTRHHILPRYRGGGDEKGNILMLPAYKHQAFHEIFGHRTIDEAISYLQEIKERHLRKVQ